MTYTRYLNYRKTLDNLFNNRNSQKDIEMSTSMWNCHDSLKINKGRMLLFLFICFVVYAFYYTVWRRFYNSRNSWVCISQCLVYCVVFCLPLFLFLFVFIWSLLSSNLLRYQLANKMDYLDKSIIQLEMYWQFRFE
jgi:hypothetical protein